MRAAPRILGFALLAVLSLAAAGESSVVQVSNTAQGWVLLVDGATYTVKGVAYTPVKVGEDPSAGTLRDWMTVDDNQNGLIDAPYEAYVDYNGDGHQERNEPRVGDFRLLQNMGVNTIRVYHHASNAASVQAGYGTFPGTFLQYNHAPNKALLRDLFATYGIRVAMGDFLGAYGIGSGVSVTDYNDATQRSRMIASVQQMANDFKDEPFLLMYVLGNENTGISSTNAQANPAAYASVVDAAAQAIHAIDPNHPVAIAEQDVNILSQLNTNATHLDIYGANVYRGSSFFNFFSQVKAGFDRPALITEYGNPSNQFTNGVFDEAKQSSVHQALWQEIVANLAGSSGVRNAIGGFAYEWLDEWWQDGLPTTHNLGAGGYAGTNNEWNGIAAQGPTSKEGVDSPFQRQLRQVYYTYKSLWWVAPAGAVQSVGSSGGVLTYNYAGGPPLAITVPAGRFNTSVQITAQSPIVFPPDLTGTMLPSGVGADLSVSPAAQPSGTVSLALSYSASSVSGLDPAHLVLARWDTTQNTWVILPSTSDPTNLRVLADTDHLSLFQIVQFGTGGSVSDPSNVKIFPNPFRPSQGASNVTFSQIPNGARIRIYTLDGVKVRELRADTGFALWNGANDSGKPVASGVYLVYIDGSGGTVTRKVVVQR